MKIGLIKTLWSVFQNRQTQIPINWGIRAVESDKLRKPLPASPAKKQRRKMVQASQRRNRRI